MMNFIKEKPLASASATVSAIIAILGAFWAINNHYATAADLQAVQQQIVDTRQGFSKQVTQMRINDLDDKVFALQLKQNQNNGKLDAIDAAMLQRYQRQEQQLTDQLNKTAPTAPIK